MADGTAELERSLAGCRVLVVEDQYFIADDVRSALEMRGATVVGPVGRLDEAFALLGDAVPIHLAVIDIDLHGERAYGLADALRARGIPIIFATGYGADAIPAAYAGVLRWEKPYRYEALVASLAALRAPPE